MAKETLFTNKAETVEIKGRMTDNGTLLIQIKERKFHGKSLSIELNGPEMRGFMDEIGRETGYCKTTEERF
jgi:hypothetical protein